MIFPATRRIVLGLAGSTALVIGLAITCAPVAFYASYGIALTPQPNLMSELRAPGANLATLGLIILAGAFFQRMARTAAFLGAAVFIAFATGRVVSLIVDGRPADTVLAALGVEAALGVSCLLVARPKGLQRRGGQGSGLAA